MIPFWVVMWLPVAVTGAFGVLLVGAWLRGTGRGGADDTDGESAPPRPVPRSHAPTRRTPNAPVTATGSHMTTQRGITARA